MVHHRQGLPLRLEASDDLAAIHAGLDDLERDLALHGLRLLGHKDRAHATLADLLQELVGTNHRAWPFTDRLIGCAGEVRNWRFQEAAGSEIVFQQFFDVPFEFRVAGTGLVEVFSAFRLRIDLDEVGEDRFDVACCGLHGSGPRTVLLSMRKNEPNRLRQSEKYSRKSARPSAGPCGRGALHRPWTLPYNQERAYTQ